MDNRVGYCTFSSGESGVMGYEKDPLLQPPYPNKLEEVSPLPALLINYAYSLMLH